MDEAREGDRVPVRGGQPCPLCGSPNTLYDDGKILDPGLPELDCTACLWEGTREALQFEVERACREWWDSLDAFMKDVMRCRSGELALERLAVGLLRRAMEPRVVLELMLRINETLENRCLAGEVEEVALRAAAKVAAEQERTEKAVGRIIERAGEQRALFGRPSVER